MNKIRASLLAGASLMALSLAIPSAWADDIDCATLTGTEITEGGSVDLTSTDTGAAIIQCTINQTGEYDITAASAEGGAGDKASGTGALIGGDFDLTDGEVLDIAVGEAGVGNGAEVGGNGGGGGSFVVEKIGTTAPTYTPLVIAGGGGGGGINTAGGNGLATTSGGSGGSTGGNGSGGGGGGSLGQGGSGGGNSEGGGGGGGFGSNGSAGTDSPNGGGYGGDDFANGLAGGVGSFSAADGGFGGGGGGGGGAGGGGGGYSGGGGGGLNLGNPSGGYGGGGGGSYLASSLVALTADQTGGASLGGNGYVTIDFVPLASAVPEPSALALFGAGLGLLMLEQRRRRRRCAW